ncbi:MAG: hypothetical protein IT531_03475 [Burkholderiales bacterium]|nr:hypothetical protein [Burkholderiales bacterium]
MIGVLRFLAQLALYVPLMVILGYFSSAPRFAHLPQDRALMRVSFSHAGERLRECHQRTPEELAKLPPNMRSQLDCPRERSPLKVEVELDGRLLLSLDVPPSGLHHDGAATVYRRIELPTGRHEIAVRMRDRPHGDFNHRATTTLDLPPGGSVLIDFDNARGGFRFRS